MMGAMTNFFAPIVLGLAPWAVVLADRSAGAPWALFANALSIGLGSIGLVVLSHLVAKTLSVGAAIKDRAEFMIRVARLAQRSGMLDDAKECLNKCLEPLGKEVFERDMINYFGIGDDGRIGLGFDMNRTNNRYCNKAVY